MIVKIKLNDIKYRYEVYHIVNLFFDLGSVQMVDNEYDYYINISSEKVVCKSKYDVEEFVFQEDITFKEFIKKSIFKYFKNKTKKELPWGTLIGIRPSKIALDLINKGKTEEEIINHFINHNMTRKDKAQLCIDVAKVEKTMVNKDNHKVSVYIDMPFCPTKCFYCSFTSNPISKCKNIVKPYLKALSYEIKYMSNYIKDKNLKIENVYFGGGTPTSIDEESFEYIMNEIYSNFVSNKNICEFTVECGRPDSISLSKLETMKKYKVNRISINPQTMNDSTLKSIGRAHTSQDVVEKFKLARKLGFGNINMDLIIGLPGEGLREVENTCNKILNLKPDSITIHGLAIKRGSILYESIVNNNKMNTVSQKEINEMYNEIVKLSDKLGMKPYYMYRQKNMLGNMENVGYSILGKEGIYNIQMIEERQCIIAIGAGAVSKVIFLDKNRIERVANVKDVREYIKRVTEMVEKKEKAFNELYKSL
jgi:coproporphyrinogen dehydrogenase HemZ